MPGSPVLAADAGVIDSIGTPGLWAAVLGAVVVLLVVDFLVTRKPHEVSIRDAIGLFCFYVAWLLMFCVIVVVVLCSELGNY